MAKQRQVRVEQKSALAAMQRLESRSDEELAAETRYKSAAQAILGARAAERMDAKRAREHFRAAIAASRPQDRLQLRRMAEASLALAERRAGDLKVAAEKLGQTPPTNRQLFALRVMGVIAPPASAGMLRRIGGILIVLLAIVLLIVLGFGIVKLIALPFGGIGTAVSFFWGFMLVSRRARGADRARAATAEARAGPRGRAAREPVPLGRLGRVEQRRRQHGRRAARHLDPDEAAVVVELEHERLERGEPVRLVELPSIRLAALSKAHVIYIWTHDSIALGEDGPTHQPVEQLASLRAMPNMMVIRPSDATETVEAWRVALRHTGRPCGARPHPPEPAGAGSHLLASATGLAQGAYILAEAGGSPPEVILIATGSEVSLALEAHARLAGDGIRSRVVSMPCWELFERQPESYRDTVLPPSVRARVSIEAASPFGWERYVGLDGAIIGVADFGASAPGPVVMREFGFTPEHVVETAKRVLQLSGLQ